MGIRKGYGMPFRRSNGRVILFRAEVTGSGIFYPALKRGLDVLLQHRNADPQRVAVTGLSGGGWQTIVLSALDTRVTLSVPVTWKT